MTPMEAWSIISANLAHLYKMRKTEKWKGYDDADTEAECFFYKGLDGFTGI